MTSNNPYSTYVTQLDLIKGNNYISGKKLNNFDEDFRTLDIDEKVQRESTIFHTKNMVIDLGTNPMPVSDEISSSLSGLNLVNDQIEKN